jgi:uncharacterized protein YcbK (DUF882 family)
VRLAQALQGLTLSFLLQSGALAEDKTLSFKVARAINADRTISYYDERPRYDDAGFDYGDAVTKTFTYSRDGKYDKDELEKINYMLRDRQSGKPSPNGMNPKLLDRLYDLKTALETKQPGLSVVFHVISGYRAPETNEKKRTDPNNPYRSGIAQNSLHTHANAIDIFVPEAKEESLRDTAWRLANSTGGVGSYPQFKFPYPYIHVDLGPRRYWGFKPESFESAAELSKR